MTAGARCSDGAGAGVLRSAADAPGFASPFWKAFFNLRATGASTVEEADFYEFTHVLEFVKDGFAVDAKILGKLVHTFFVHITPILGRA